MRQATRALVGFIFGFVMLATAVRAADGRLAGRLVAPGDRPLSGVEVAIETLGLVTATDAGGEFALAPVPPGSHVVRLQLGGFVETATVEVADGAVARLDRELDWEEAFAETITVFSASRRAERVTEAPAAVTIVPAARIEREAAHGQLPKLLEFTPGAQVTQSGVYDFNFNTRGLNSSLNRRVAVVIDGREPSVPFLGAQEWAAVSFPLDDLEQVEFVRGPSAALYGANASSGVLNLLTRRPRGSEGGLVRLAGGEMSTFNADARWAGRMGEHWWGKALGGYRQSGDFTVSRNGAAEYTVPCSAAVTSDCLPQEAVGLDPLDDNEIAFASARADRYFGDANLLTLEGGWADVSGPVFQTGIGRVQLVDVERRWFRGNVATPRWNFLVAANLRDAPEQTALATGNNLALDEESWKGEIQAHQDFAGGRVRLVGGASYRDDRIDSGDDNGRIRPGLFARSRQTLIFESLKTDFSAFFAQLDWNLSDQLKLVLAGRYDDSSLHDPEFSPKGSLVWGINHDNSLRLTYNRAFQVPNYSEYFLQAEIRPALNLGAVPCFEKDPATGQYVPCVGRPLVNLEELCALDGEVCGFDTDFVPGEGPEYPGLRPAGEITPDTLLLALGNADLEVETVETWELGYTGILADRIFLTADYYRSENDNFITDLLPQLGTSLGRVNPAFGPLQLPDGLSAERREQILFILQRILGPTFALMSNNVDGVPILALASYSNFGSVDTQGVDLGVDWSIDGRWSLALAYSWFDFEIQDSRPGLDRLLLPNSPENSASANLSFVGSRFDASLGYRWSDSFRWSVGPFQGEVPDYGVVDLIGNFELDEHWSLGLNVSNLLDDEHWESFGGDVLGRRALGSVTFRW